MSEHSERARRSDLPLLSTKETSCKIMRARQAPSSNGVSYYCSTRRCQYCSTRQLRTTVKNRRKKVTWGVSIRELSNITLSAAADTGVGAAAAAAAAAGVVVVAWHAALSHCRLEGGGGGIYIGHNRTKPSTAPQSSNPPPDAVYRRYCWLD
jgi:hypothetical protein